MSPTDNQATDARDQVRRWRADDIARLTDTPRPTLLRSIIPDMRAAGVLVSRGRYWYARQRDIEDFLLGRYTAATATARPQGKGGAR